MKLKNRTELEMNVPTEKVWHIRRLIFSVGKNWQNLMKFIFLTIICLSFVNCFQSKDKYKGIAIVFADENPKLKSEPNMKSKTILDLQPNQRLSVLNDKGIQETIRDRNSRWMEVETEEKRGWVFGGFVKFKKNYPEPLEKMPSANTFTNSIAMEFMLIPPGKFKIGCSRGDNKCSSTEKPVHEVQITKPFYISKYEITLKQWKLIMNDVPILNDCGENCPVVNISWDQTQEFIEKLNINEHRNQYRLSTEAEWEYAARSGTDTIFYWGNSMDESFAWYNKNSKDNVNPVGLKKSNAFGLFDMVGNSAEWTNDWYEYGYDETVLENPQGPNSGSMKVVRGGSYYSDSENIQISRRFAVNPEKGLPSVGFRLVLSAQDSD